MWSELIAAMRKSPRVAVDFIIRFSEGLVLVKRKYEVSGWDIPGGFVEYGETAEQAVAREAKEETGLDVEIESLLGVYSDPKRDPRGHTISAVFVCRGKGKIRAGDDAAEARVFRLSDVPVLVFDHNKVIEDFRKNEKQ